MSQFFIDLKSFLTNPKFLHVLLGWGQMWGLLVGIVVLAVGKWGYKEMKTMKLGIGIMLVASLLSWGMAWNAKVARPETFTAATAEARKTQETRRNEKAVFFYIFAGLCLVHLIAKFEPPSAKFFFSVMVTGGIILMLISLWFQIKESQLVYREF